MRCFIASILFLALLVVGCSHDELTQPTQNPTVQPTAPNVDSDATAAAAAIIKLSGWELDPEVALPANATDPDPKCLGFISDPIREELPGNVAHYSYRMRVGWGPHDFIRLHRVVKERRPYRPIRTRHAIFLQHGDAVGFVKFLFGAASPSAPDDHAAAVYLAQHDVDVWGIDQNWVLVPEETADFGFMQDWGMDNQISNLRQALATARLTRLFTGSGYRKMPLLGYSSGGWLGFSYLNDEAGRPGWQRHVNGFVNADAYFKVGPDNEVGRQVNCADAMGIGEDLANGVYEWWVGFAEVGDLALTDPDGPSPIFPGFTNVEVAHYFGGAGFLDYPLNAWWHYWGAEFDGNPADGSGFPIGFRFLPDSWAFEFMTTAAAWQAQPFFYDYCRISCNEVDVPWDDNLADITVPVLNLGGAGGLAPSAEYTLGLLGSADVQNVIVQLLPDDQPYEDFGHIDMWTAIDAPQLIWHPMLQWLMGHGAERDENPYPAMAD